MDSVSSARWAKGRRRSFNTLPTAGVLKRWFCLSISSIASEDADIHVVCHLENEASMSNNKARCPIASCSDRQLKYEPVQSITKIHNYFSVTGNISIITAILKIPRKGSVAGY